MVTFKSYLTYRRTDNPLKVSRFRSICFFSLEATCWHIYGGLRYYHSGSEWGKNQKLNPNEKPNRVGLFWDLDNKPPNAIPPFDVANKLRIIASSFGIVRYMVAYSNEP
ncbi:hypothetical protein VIGAN_11072200 [Vigna angularis var. angularis]|uniref:NYN domain-containing protein n=1 Tax=Vigna angularis var. angularis TaxID=157739 RepID=A0A0S3T896_PHAAN|nr:hypothetical protein VIGAN_11072200 [Vigna angularis var. angularis]